MTADLILFLRARFAEDAAEVEKQPVDAEYDIDAWGIQHSAIEGNYAYVEYLRVAKARALAELEAKRRFLTRYEEVTAASAASGIYSDVQEEYDWLLNLMWTPYAEHPDFDEEWRP